MKLLIVFALIVVAYAEQIQVVNLPEAPSPGFAIPSIGQLIIPNAVIEAWKKDFEAIKVALPIMREAAVANDEGLKVNFVDAPLDKAAPQPITLGEPSLPAFETADEVEMIAEPSLIELVPEPVNFVEAPLPNETPIFVDGPPPLPMEEDVLAEPNQAELIPEPVNFIEAPLPNETPIFVDGPPPLPMEDDVLAEPNQAELIPEPVNFIEAPLPNETPIFVDGPPPLPMEDDVLAEPNQELIPEPIKFVEAPRPVVEADAAEPSLTGVVPEPVKFVDAPPKDAVESIKIAIPKLKDYRDKIFNNPMLRSSPTA